MTDSTSNDLNDCINYDIKSMLDFYQLSLCTSNSHVLVIHCLLLLLSFLLPLKPQNKDMGDIQIKVYTELS